MIRLIALHSITGPGGDTPPGNEFRADATEAASLVARGAARYPDPRDVMGAELPEDTPYRDVLQAAGIRTLDDIAAVAELTSIPGIGRARAEALAEFLAAGDPEPTPTPDGDEGEEGDEPPAGLDTVLA